MPELKNVKVDFVSLVDRAAVRDPSAPSEPRRFLVWKSERGTPNSREGGTVQTAEELTAELEKAQAKIAKLEKKLAKKSGDTPAGETPETTTLDKSDLPPEVRKHIEKAEQEAERTRERAEKAEKIAKDERDRRVLGEFIAKAETLPNLQSTPATLGPILKRASEALSKEDYDQLEQVLSTANEQVATGKLFDELGSNGAVVKSDAESEVLRKAEELRKADPKLSLAKAMDQVFESDRALQAKYLAAVR